MANERLVRHHRLNRRLSPDHSGHAPAGPEILGTKRHLDPLAPNQTPERPRVAPVFLVSHVSSSWTHQHKKHLCTYPGETARTRPHLEEILIGSPVPNRFS